MIQRTMTFNVTITVDDEDADMLERLYQRYVEGRLQGAVTTAVSHNSRYNGYSGMPTSILARQGKFKTKGMTVDHINRDPGDNRRTNLRILSQADNLQNRVNASIKPSQYVGVTWNKENEKWLGRVTWSAGGKAMNKAVYWGDSELDAARAYNAYVIENKLDKPLNELPEEAEATAA